jgi:hypothetical protein
MDWRDLGRRLGRETLLAEVCGLRPVRVLERAEKPLDVVMLTMMGGNHRLASVEVVLGRALLARGHRVRYVLCDQALPACEVKWEGEESRWQAGCAKCHEFGRRYLESAGYDVLPVTRLIGGCEAERTWPEYVESALLKHYHVGVLSESPEIEERRALFRAAAGVSERVGRAVARLRPDRVVMSHGIYCTWGPSREILLEAGIPLVTYGEGKKKDTMKFNWNTSADWWDVSERWEAMRGVALTPEQEEAISDYLLSRRSHERDARVYNFGREETLYETRLRLGLETGKQTFVLFTNVLWDAASAQREIAFNNPVDWVLETIGWFGLHPEKQLVVKIHPAEVVIGTKQPFASVISKRFPKLPPNVRVIEPQENVNSWSIMRVADLALVHTSTVGMEVPLEGIPCAVVSRTHYRGRGFTIDVESRNAYFDMLQNWDGATVDPEELKVLSKKYAYVLFELYQLPFPFLWENSVNDVRALVGIREEELVRHPTIRLFLNAFENHSDFLLPI